MPGRALDELVEAGVEGGYWIAGDDSAAARRSLTGRCPLGAEPGGVHRVELLSDGLEHAWSMMGVYSSPAKLLTALVHEGPEACIRAVRAVEQSDPDGRASPDLVV